MDIRSEFWSAVEKAKTQKVVKKVKNSKIITLSNEPAYYYDIITNENLNNDIDAEIMSKMTKVKGEKKITKFSMLETVEESERRRREWRLRNNMFEKASTFSPSAAAAAAAAGAAGAGGGSGNRRIIEETMYVVDDYVFPGYVE